MAIPPILCVTGPSGTGKTRLLEGLISRLTRRGLRVAAVKHGHRLDMDASGKDDERLADAGADPAVAASDAAVQARGRGDPPPLLDLVGTFCRGRDLVLVEGYRRCVHDKIVVGAAGGPETSQWREPEGVRLRVSGEDVDAVLSWLLSWLERRRAMRKQLTAAVLTGGASRRMGTDKASLRIAGESVLARLGSLLADRVGRVMFVGAEPDWRDLPACLCGAWHPDVVANRGPMGGVATALRIAASGRRPAGVCVVACDMPAFGGELLDHLLTGRDPQAVATAPVNPAIGRVEPLAAIYEPQALPSIEQALAGPKPSLTDWLKAAGAHRLPLPAELAGQCAGVNTPDELRAIRSRAERTSS